MSEDNRKPLVVFSGGMDSTYMLWQQLKEGDVHTCYIHAAQSPLKVPKELEARSKIIPFLEELTGNKVLRDTIVKIGNSEKTGRAVEMETRMTSGRPKEDHNLLPDRTWNQAHMWLFGALYVSDGQLLHSKLLIGNVMGDDISSKLSDQSAAWHHLQAFSKHHPIPLEFPLMMFSKDRILRELPIELLKLIWICELPDVAGVVSHPPTPDEVHLLKPCNKCPACITMLQTLWVKDHRERREHSRTLEEYIEVETRPYYHQNQMSFDFPWYISNEDQPKDYEG